MRDRAWLRSFLDLGARRAVEGIRSAAIRRQEDTVLAALDVLEREPGVLLADEVGMGKTYQALGIVAATFEACRARGRAPKVLVVTPHATLNHQWHNAGVRFREHRFYPFPRGAFAEVTRLDELPAACADHPVVLVPVHAFTGARAQAERGFLLALWKRNRAVHGNTWNAVWSRVEDAGIPCGRARRFLGRELRDFADVPAAAFARRGTGAGFRGLDDLLEEGLDAFRSADAVRRALDRARFHVVRSLLPPFDLLLVDEAHKLKNPWSVRSQAVAQLLGGTYERAVFLTATPFQLDVAELRRVFELFRGARSVRAGFAADVDALFGAIDEYRGVYREFESRWRFVTPEMRGALERWLAATGGAADPSADGLDDPNTVAVARIVRSLLALKQERVEPGFRRWTLRSLKPEKRERRDPRHHPPIRIDGRSALPVLLFERLLAERARIGRRTHVVAADVSVASSFAAAAGADVVATPFDDPGVRSYQELLARVLPGERERERHPKVRSVVEDALAAARKGEKTLIFCERVATLGAITAELERRWQELHRRRWRRIVGTEDEAILFGDGKDGAPRGQFQKLADRFRGGRNPLCLALRESYPFTLLVPPDEDGLPAALWRDRDALLAEANRVLAGLRSSRSSAAKVDYRLARRCVDQAVARWFDRHAPATLDRWGGLPRRLLADDYVPTGIDGVADDDEREVMGEGDHAVTWTITPRVFDNVLSARRPGLWFPLRERLAAFEAEERVQLVDAVRHYLVQRQVTFLVELLGQATTGDASTPSGAISDVGDVSSDALRAALGRWWRTGRSRWGRQLAELLDYLLLLNTSRRGEVIWALRNPQFARHTLDGRGRSSLQDAFNAPVFPMVLVGNQTVQEGVDLHRQCRRVVHHDLRWNPADLEQRIGRVDRHGSRSERLHAEGLRGAEACIAVRYPLLERTIDRHQFRVVKEREKWLEFLLGRPPEVGAADVDTPAPEPLPAELVDALRVDLAPAERP